MRVKIALFVFPIAALLSACAASTPVPTATPALTDTPAPTDTLVPSETLPAIDVIGQPTGTPATTKAGYFDSPIPVWNGIPIMKGALSGSGDDTTYRFAINTSPDVVAAYYAGELPGLGWKTVSTGNVNGTITLVYEKGQMTVKMSIGKQASFTVIVLTKNP